jgi:acyl-CoA thioesterase FadM
MATIDMCINYHKPIFENDRLEVIVCLKSLGKTIASLTGEGFDKEKNLIATASTNIMLLNSHKKKIIK